MVLSVRGPRLLMWEAQDCIRLQGPIVHIMRVFSLPCRMVQEVVKQLGGLHIAINNAGINKNAAAEDTTEEDWDMTFDVNTKGVFLCCQVGKLQVVSCSCCWQVLCVLSGGNKAAKCLHQWHGPVLSRGQKTACLINVS